MKFFSILLGLATMAIAIDIRFTNELSCNGWYAACSNINPGICCSMAATTLSVIFAAVPSNWNIRGSAFLLENCSNFLISRDSRGDMCFGHERRIQSARYEFISGKLARSPATGEINTRSASEDCQKVDTFILANGTKYPIDQLTDGEVQYLIEQATNGTAEAAVQELQLATIEDK